MQKFLLRFKKHFRALKKSDKYYWAQFKYMSYYRKLKIDEKAVLIESQQGRSPCGNMFYLLRELAGNPDYREYKIYFCIRKAREESTRQLLERYSITNYEFVIISSKKYYKLMASAKYLFTDTAFQPFYIKKAGQVYLNTWHGTPLKCLGKKSLSDMHTIGNVQKNFIVSDYLLYPNEFTMEHMVEDYMLPNLTNAEVLLSGYPRNTAFYDTSNVEQIKEELEITDKQVFVYMPTWRGSSSTKENKITNTYLLYYLLEIDKNLTDNQVMFVSLHPLARGGVDFNLFSHILRTPVDYETYDFLNIADCLITDYSSVMFDYAITGKKIVLFTYDEEYYLSSRGMYLGLDELPFPKAHTVPELFEQLGTEKNYDDTEFLQRFCKYESADASRKLCDFVIRSADCDIKTHKIEGNGKENILIYAGNLAKNGITTALKSLINSVDREDKNYYLSFMSYNREEFRSQVQEFSQLIDYIPMAGYINFTAAEKILDLLFVDEFISAKVAAKLLSRSWKLDIRRLFGDAKFSSAIQFCGYELRKIIMFSQFDANNVIYVHSDMKNEIRSRSNQRKDVLKYAYKTYDKVAIVTENTYETTRYFNKKASNFYVAKNLIDYKGIEEKAGKEIAFDPYTKSNMTLEELVQKLDSATSSLITIGRFSVEKNHRLLIDTFDKAWHNDNSIFLVIIGGCGVLYNKTVEYAQTKDSRDSIALIMNMSNPYAVLAKCNGLVLTSKYEGFGLVLVEADVLGVPVISTDIDGPRDFMKQNGGVLVENSFEGVYNGITDLISEKIKPMNVDYEQYNRKAIEQFYALLK